ncbi:MAG: hypothetical protein RIA64_01360 [Rhodospirillales bacterium]
MTDLVEMMDDEVDRILFEWGFNYSGLSKQITEAALQALNDAGYAVVPREPTKEMIKDAENASRWRMWPEDSRAVYRAMIKAGEE